MLVIALRVCKMCKADSKLSVELVLARFDLLDMHVSYTLHMHYIAIDIVCHVKKLILLLSIFENKMGYGVIYSMSSERHNEYAENHLCGVSSYIIPNTI